jgi:hypothetical protein
MMTLLILPFRTMSIGIAKPSLPTPSVSEQALQSRHNWDGHSEKDQRRRKADETAGALRQCYLPSPLLVRKGRALLRRRIPSRLTINLLH